MEKIKLNSKILAVASVLAILFGSWLILSSPARKADKSLNIAQQLVVVEENKLTKFNSDFEDELNWYKKEYTSPILLIISSCQEKMNQANSEIKLAQDSRRSKDKRAHTDKAQKLITTIADDLLQAQSQISVFEKMTADARKSLERVNSLVPEAMSLQSLAHQRIIQEGQKYLSKYVNLNQEKLNQVQNNLSLAAEARQRSFDLLPIENGSEHLGDPNGALEFIKVAEDNITSAKSNAQEIIKNFDFYLEATNRAAPSIDISKQKIATASNYLDSLVVKGPLQADKALKASFDKVAQAGKVLAEATSALETLTAENKYDLPLAYSSALKTLELANGSITEADRQVALFTEVTSGLKQLRVAIDELQKSINNSKPYRNNLNNHNPNTWSNVSDNINVAKDNCETVRRNLPEIEGFISFYQLYEKATSTIQDNLNLLNNGETLVSNLVEVAKSLEDYRSDWPSAKRQAENTINNEVSNINSYGSYDSSAQSDFNSAQSYLSSANSLASNREYQSAVEKAKQAHRLADGTGSRAYRTYEDEQAAERARQQAAEDLANSFNSSDSWGGSSSSSSDSSSSYSSSSDSGSWSGSSSSSDSGGWSSSSSSSSDGGGWE